MEPLILNPELPKALLGATVTDVGLDLGDGLHIVFSNGARLILPAAELHVIAPVPPSN